MSSPTRLTPWSNPACLTYLVIGLLAAAGVALALAERTIGLFAIVPSIVACAGLVFCWTNAPVFVLLSLAIAILIGQPAFFPQTQLVELILAATIATYVAAHYRLCSLTTSILPTDPRKSLTPQPRPPSPPLPAIVEFLMAITVIPYLVYLALRTPPPRRPAEPPDRRNVAEITGDEVARLLCVILLCSGLALAIWLSTYWRPAPLNALSRQWQLGIILWSLLTPLILIATMLSYLRWRKLSYLEARLALNDELWKQTRPEQRSIARWTVWARRRKQPEVRP